jgi:hypothetical protein
MNLALLRSLLLAALLMLTQLAAVTHALSHQQGGHPEELPQVTCVWCACYAHLEGPPPPAARVFIAPTLVARTTPVHISGPSQLPLRLAYRSHAPPFAA